MQITVNPITYLRPLLLFQFQIQMNKNSY